MGFEQATIKVEQEKEFGELKGAIERMFRPEKSRSFSSGWRRQASASGTGTRCSLKVCIERVDDNVGKSTTARKLYEALPVSDQAQMREFYLSKLEEVDEELRTKYQKDLSVLLAVES